MLRSAVAVAALLLAAAGSTASAVSARGQPETCPASEDEAATVSIASPGAGAVVGGMVGVSGRVESSAPVFRVELFVGDSRQDFVLVDPPVAAVDFALAWDATAVTDGAATLHVVACGGSAALGQLTRGSASVEVQVQGQGETGSTVTLAVDRPDEGSSSSSVVAGAFISVPAIACFIYAVGRRRAR